MFSGFSFDWSISKCRVWKAYINGDTPQAKTRGKWKASLLCLKNMVTVVTNTMTFYFLTGIIFLYLKVHYNNLISYVNGMFICKKKLQADFNCCKVIRHPASFGSVIVSRIILLTSNFTSWLILRVFRTAPGIGILVMPSRLLTRTLLTAAE